MVSRHEICLPSKTGSLIAPRFGVLSFWSKGEAVWKVTHAGDGDDRYELSTSGALPDAFEQTRQSHFDTQKKEGDDVDFIFEISLELARHAIDFRHEDYLEAGKDIDVFITAEPNRPAKKGLISRLFGR